MRHPVTGFLIGLLSQIVMTDAHSQDFPALRARMVDEVDATYAETQRETGLAAMSEPVRAAMGKVERHRLVPPAERYAAYQNRPLPIGSGQTISQPYIVALSTDLLQVDAHSVVLDVGTGSGYQAAVLAEIVRQVYSIDIIEPLVKTAAERLAELGYRNIEVKVGDGYKGWPEKGPFDAIVVAATAPKIPQALVDQLKPGGRMVIPVGDWRQDLKVVTKRPDGGYDERDVLPVRFVPLVPRN